MNKQDERPPVQLIFWCSWLVVGYVALQFWLGSACPPGGCNFMLVLLQLPELIGPALGWLALGIAISVGIASRASSTDEMEAAAPNPEEPPAT